MKRGREKAEPLPPSDARKKKMPRGLQIHSTNEKREEETELQGDREKRAYQGPIADRTEKKDARGGKKANWGE